jgi:hypothetical protein
VEESVNKKPPVAGGKLTDFFSGLLFDPVVEVMRSSLMTGCLQSTQYYNPEDQTIHIVTDLLKEFIGSASVNIAIMQQ